jgi:mono/diheme cytochrome c family protein
MPDGEIFNTISNGIRTMPSYRHQIPAADRWAIIAYLRALERSQHAALEDLRPDELEKLKQ